MDLARRNVLVLSTCQALSMGGMVILTTVVALAGQVLADDDSLATVPLALQLTANMLMAIPASLLMSRIGRRAGFTLGQFLGIIGGALGVYTLLYAKSFGLLCVAGLLLGAHNAFWQFYRFAAVDTADEAYRSRAISYVLAGGVVAALVAPEIAKRTVDMFDPILFAGAYVSFIALCVINIIVLQFLRIPRPPASWRFSGGRPLSEIIRQPTFLVAVLSAMVGYALMVLVMTATPLSMVNCGFAFTDAAFVIQWHAFAMFAPGFFTGHLIRKFGVTVVIMVGCLLYLVAMGFNLSGIAIENFWFGLVVVGLGWNFTFVGGTTLLTEVYRPEEKAKVQAINDFFVFGTSAVASFSSGALQHLLGWDAVNLAVIAPALIVFVAAFWLHRQRHTHTA